MKICQLCAVDFTLQKFLLRLIDGMESAGWNVTSVCSDGKSIDELRSKGYQIITVPISRSMNPIKHIFSIWNLIDLFRREKYDVIHVHTPVAALIARIAAKLTKIPLIVYTAHGFYFHDDMPSWKRNFHIALERFAGKYTDLLFTQSSQDAVTAVEEKIIEQDKVFVIGNGVNVSLYNPEKISKNNTLRKSFLIPDDAFVICMVGRLVKEKGVVEFLESAIRLAENNENVWFVLVGERLKSDHAIGVESVVQEAKKKLGNRLILTGLRQDIPSILWMVDLFCLPSWREGMPRTIIEAMMMAKPVIATDIRGSNEEVINEETGLLVPIRSPEKLAEAMQRCIDKPFWSKLLGIEGRKRALNLYDERNIVSYQVDKISHFAKGKGLKP